MIVVQESGAVCTVAEYEEEPFDARERILGIYDSVEEMNADAASRSSAHYTYGEYLGNSQIRLPNGVVITPRHKPFKLQVYERMPQRGERCRLAYWKPKRPQDFWGWSLKPTPVEFQDEMFWAFVGTSWFSHSQAIGLAKVLECPFDNEHVEFVGGETKDNNNTVISRYRNRQTGKVAVLNIFG